MAQNLIINQVVYQAVPSLTVPKQGGGSAQFFDTQDGNADASTTVAGKVGYNASGRFVGSMTTVSVSQDPTSKVLTIS